MTRHQPPSLDHFPFKASLQTRWSDNDMFGHLNNVIYYRFFEAAVVKFLTGEADYHFVNEPVLTFAAETQCKFLRPLGYPGDITAGLVVEHLGRTSVRYGLGLFGAGENQASATGHWVHVFVDRATQRPVPVPEPIRAVFERFLVKADV